MARGVENDAGRSCFRNIIHWAAAGLTAVDRRVTLPGRHGIDRRRAPAPWRLEAADDVNRSYD